MDGFGSKGAKPRPFRQDLAVREFNSWVYTAAMLNAQAVASVPLRLYVRKGASSYFRTRKMNGRRSQRAYMLGDGPHRPSKSVVQKVGDFGADFEEVTERHPALDVLSDVNDWQNG